MDKADIEKIIADNFEINGVAKRAREEGWAEYLQAAMLDMAEQISHNQPTFLQPIHQPIQETVELENTVELMCSKKYKDRFKAEYQQLAIRHDKLMYMVLNWDNLDFTPTVPKSIYERQLKVMREYFDILNERARIEGITGIAI
jgi:hypothetical protein